MFFTAAEIQILIQLIHDQKPVTQTTHATGPGQINLHELLNGNKTPWSRVVPQLELKPTFIICSPDFIRYNPNQKALEFLQSLLHHQHTVLLWTGFENNVEQLLPYNSIEDLIHNMQHLKLAASQDVKMWLAQQNKDLKKYCIIDAEIDFVTVKQYPSLFHEHRIAERTRPLERIKLKGFFTDTTSTYTLRWQNRFSDIRDALGSNYSKSTLAFDYLIDAAYQTEFLIHFPNASYLKLASVETLEQLSAFIDHLPNLKQLKIETGSIDLVQQLDQLSLSNIEELSLVIENRKLASKYYDVDNQNNDDDNDFEMHLMRRHDREYPTLRLKCTSLDLRAFPKCKSLFLSLGLQPNISSTITWALIDLKNSPSDLKLEINPSVNVQLSQNGLNHVQELVIDGRFIQKTLHYLYAQHPCRLKRIFVNNPEYYSEREINNFFDYPNKEKPEIILLEPPQPKESFSQKLKKALQASSKISNRFHLNINSDDQQFIAPSNKMQALDLTLTQGATRNIDALIDYLKQTQLMSLSIPFFNLLPIPSQNKLLAALAEQSKLVSLTLGIHNLWNVHIPDLNHLQFLTFDFSNAGQNQPPIIIFNNLPKLIGLTSTHYGYESCWSLVSEKHLSQDFRFNPDHNNVVFFHPQHPTEPKKLLYIYGDAHDELDDSDISVYNSRQNNQFTLDRYQAANSTVPLSGNVQVEILDKDLNRVNPDDILYQQFNQLIFNKNKRILRFEPQARSFLNSQQHRLLPQCQNYQSTHSVARARMAVTWGEENCIPIPVFSTFVRVVAVDSDSDIRVDYDENNQQWVLIHDQLRPNTKSTIELFLDDPTQNQESHLSKINEQNCNHDLIHYVKNFIKAEIPKLNFIYDEQIPVQKRIYSAMQYFTGFVDLSDVKDINSDTDCDLFESLLKNKKGVCQHIAFVFSVMLASIKVTTAISMNDRHALSLVAYTMQDSNTIWSALPVSGFGKRHNPNYQLNNEITSLFSKDLKSLLTPQDKLTDEQYLKLKAAGVDLAMALDDVQKCALSLKLNEHLLNQFKIRQRITESPYKKAQQFFSRLVQNIVLRNTEQLLLAASHCHVLIKVSGSQTAQHIHFALSDFFHKQQGMSNYLYINNPNDFDKFWNAYQIKASGLTKNESVLGIQIKNQNATILINWKNFSDDDLTEYLSLLESNNRLLNGESLVDQCRVIGVLPSVQEVCVTFDSRCLAFELSKKWFDELEKTMPKIAAPHNINDVIEVRSFQTPQWQKGIEGEITVDAGQFKLGDSPLLTALQLKKQLTLLAPNPTCVDTLIERFTIERRAFFNGQFIDTSNLKLALDETPYQFSLPRNVKIISDKLPQSGSSYFVLNTQTYFDLLSTLEADPQKKLTTKKGLLDLNKKLQQICVTDDITLIWPEIEPVLAAADRPIQLFLSGNGKLNYYHATMHHLQPKQITDPAQIEKARRIYLDPSLGYSEIIGSSDVKINDDLSCSFNENGLEVLDWLSKGNNIILIGELSVELELHLQSLFSDDPHIWKNGQRMAITGRIFHLAKTPAMIISNPPTPISVFPDAWNPPALQNKITVLQGESGNGKSHRVREWVEQHDVEAFYGIGKLQAFLQCRSQKQIVLIIDEINTFKPHFWKFLFGLLDGSNIVFSHLKWADDLKNHFILGTMNPACDANRYEHQILQQYAELVTILSPTPAMLHNTIANPILKNATLAQQVVALHLLAIQIAPNMHFSLRDLIAVCYRITIAPNTPLFQHVFWQYILPLSQRDLSNRMTDGFIKQLGAITLPKPSYSRIGDLIVTPARQTLVEFLDLQMQLRFITAALTFNLGLEGPSASGKTFFILTLLTLKYQMALNHADPKKRFYQVNARSKQCADTLSTAFKDGSYVVLEELDMCSCNELLSQLLDGKDELGNRSKNLGFALSASYNPAYFKARRSIPPAMLTRIRPFKLEGYTSAENRDMVSMMGFKESAAIVDAFLQTQQSHPALNARRLFAALKDHKEELQQLGCAETTSALSGTEKSL